MKFNSVIFVLLGIVVIALAAPAPLVRAPVEERIDGVYIVVMKNTVCSGDLKSHIKSVFDGSDESKITQTFDMEGFRGYSARLSFAKLNAERNHPAVDFIEEDRVIRTFQSCNSQTNAEWGLDRISEQGIDIDGRFVFTSTSGAGVDAYIVDTGINIKHSDFGGRAIWGANYADTTNDDCNGHGTHVAGTVGGNLYGVAKKATLIAVKVLTCAGSGTNTGVISGIQYVTNQAKARKNPSVANMSLGGGKSAALDNAVAASIASGVTYAVAAGNDNQNACNYSPAGVSTAISTGATTISDDAGTTEDSRASFSNFGTCVHIFAPGQLIKSAWIGSTTAVKTISGTSMATPHVAGAVALYLGNNPSATPAQVKQYLLANTNNGMIDMLCTSTVCQQSPNKLLYSPCA